MDIPFHKKLTKLGTNLFANPDLFFKWLKTSLLSKRLPLEYPLPWWSYRAIEAAILLIKDKTVFEYGTGGSTVLFARSAKKICSVEDDSGWLEIVRQHLLAEGAKNVELIHCPFDFKNPDGFHQSTYLKSIGDDPWDVVIIDGQDWTFRERITCFEYVEPRMQPGGVIILDDFWRYRELLGRNRALGVAEFESVGPCRLGVTSTAFFQY